VINPTVEVIATISVLLIISSMTKILSKYTKIPFTILLVMVGFLIAFFMKDQPVIIQLAAYQSYPDILLYVCLATLIFEAAFTMDGRLLQKN
jgi:monovalent cation:H+ antiporter, CPA1 family